ncbi:MAG: DUF3037 domain-containing protein [Aeromonas sp.]
MIDIDPLQPHEVPLFVSYAIIRFRPHRTIEEFANIGVVMCAPKAGFFDYRIETRSFARLLGFFSGLDVSLPLTATAYVAAELQRVKTLAQEIGNAEVVQRLFSEATKGREGVIYFGEARVARITGSVDEQLDRLFEEYVAR